MWMVAFLGALTLVPDVTVQPLAGPTVAGRLAALDEERLTLEVDGETRQYGLSELLRVTRSSPPTAPRVIGPWVGLTDGSRLHVDAVTVIEDQARLELGGDEVLELPARAVRWIRYGSTDASEDPARHARWEEILNGDVPADQLVLRRDSGALDTADGLVQTVGSEEVQFEFDGEAFPVGVDRLEGVIFYRREGLASGDPRCRVLDDRGAVWQVSRMEWDGETLSLRTPGGARHALPWQRVVEIDFSAGNLVFLSDLEPTTSRWTPYLSSPTTTERLAPLFAPRRDQSLDGGPLLLGDGLDEQEYARGLALHSRTELVFRLTEDYRRLTAIAGIDSRVRSTGHVELVITGDDEELFRAFVAGEDPPVVLDLDVQGVRRLKILVDFGDNLDLGDHLNLCEARLIK